MRRRAKAINFGIIYGISAFGLANQLGIPREEAGAYIKKYFERFPGIRDYMDATKARLPRERLRHDDLRPQVPLSRRSRSKNPSERAFVERAAINAPIQGSAADIIRRAMVRMDGALARRGLSARMLLQVHDELVFEVPEEEVEATLPVVRRVMETAPQPAVQLSRAAAGRRAGRGELGRGALNKRQGAGCLQAPRRIPHVRQQTHGGPQ